MLNAQQFLNQFSLEAPLDESLYPIIRESNAALICSWLTSK
jgi:hypothetical protein